MCGSDAAYCHITLIACYHFVYTDVVASAFSINTMTMILITVTLMVVKLLL